MKTAGKLLVLFVCAVLLVNTFCVAGAKGNSTAPKLPFKLEKPVAVHVTDTTGWDTCLYLSVAKQESMLEWMRGFEDDNDAAYEGITALGYNDIEIFLQVDWAIDDSADWHYNKAWDKGERKNDDNEWEMPRLDAYRNLVDTYYILGFNYDEWNENYGGWKDVIPKSLIDDITTEDGEDSYYAINWEKHTLYVRCRWLVEVETEENDDWVNKYVSSDWSDISAYGKNGEPPYIPVEEDNVGAPVISEEIEMHDSYHGFEDPWASFTVAYDEKIVDTVSLAYLYQGFFRVSAYVSINGEEWRDIGVADDTIHGGKYFINLADAIYWDDGRSTLSESDNVRLYVVYSVSTYEGYGGSWAGEFDSSDSNIAKFGAVEYCSHETFEYTGEKNEDGHMMKCVKCGYTERQGHDFKSKTVKEPTCKTDGKEKYTCKLCGYSYTEVLDKNNNHEWEDRVVTPATCTEEGEMKKVCRLCGAEDEVFAYGPDGHSFEENAYTFDETHHWYACVKCGFKDEQQEHIFDEPRLTREPDIGVPGENTYKCCYCEYSYTEEVPAYILGDTDNDGEIRANDAQLVLLHCADLKPLEGLRFRLGDTDRDGVLRASDARRILRAAAGLEDSADW